VLPSRFRVIQQGHASGEVLAGHVYFRNFVRFADRPWSHECKSNLKSYFTAVRTQQSYPDNDFPSQLARLRFAPERGNRYAYFMASGPMEDRSHQVPRGVDKARAIGVDTFQGLPPVTFAQLPSEIARMVGVSGQCPECNMTMVCAANFDSDSTLDIWSISTADRTIGTEVISAGEVFHHVDDVEF
jgi:hypothetical protein